MEPRAVVRQLWEAMEGRDWHAVDALLDDDLLVEWPQSGESFGRASFLEINRRYPGDWHIQILMVLGEGARVVTEIEVELDGKVDRAISFFEFRGEKIRQIREYWPERMEIPSWRVALIAARE